MSARDLAYISKFIANDFENATFVQYYISSSDVIFAARSETRILEMVMLMREML